MQSELERWKLALMERGFTHKRIVPSHWTEHLHLRRHVDIIGTEGRIMEIWRGSEYIRIVAKHVEEERVIYEVARYVSREYPRCPKTDFFVLPYRPVSMIGREVRRMLSDISQNITET